MSHSRIPRQPIFSVELLLHIPFPGGIIAKNIYESFEKYALSTFV